MSTHRVELTDDEVLLLNGRCSERVQVAVDLVLHKRAIAGSGAFEGHPHAAALSQFVAEVVREARAEGRLLYHSRRIRDCPICKKSDGYLTYRSGRYRGQENYDKPLYMNGLELARRFVVMQGSSDVGGCVACVETALPVIKKALANVPCELASQLRLDDAPVYKRFDNRKCERCDWTGHEGQMGKSPTMMMDGYYPSTCPQCKAQNTFGVTYVKTVAGFTLVKQESES